MMQIEPHYFQKRNTLPLFQQQILENKNKINVLFLTRHDIRLTDNSAQNKKDGDGKDDLPFHVLPPHSLAYLMRCS
jgi:hypothetical protein